MILPAEFGRTILIMIRLRGLISKSAAGFVCLRVYKIPKLLGGGGWQIFDKLGGGVASGSFKLFPRIKIRLERGREREMQA